jgi:hypothetical protein
VGVHNYSYNYFVPLSVLEKNEKFSTLGFLLVEDRVKHYGVDLGRDLLFEYNGTESDLARFKNALKSKGFLANSTKKDATATDLFILDGSAPHLEKQLFKKIDSYVWVNKEKSYAIYASNTHILLEIIWW